MNILHHKKWHVRTKENMERVRRDERKAAEDEQRILDRQIQAENERRINTLRQRADERMETMFGGGMGGSGEKGGGATKDYSISDETGHVNLFQDLEREERKNLGTGNKDYEAEKSEEKKEWEQKMGIQVYFAHGTNDLDKKKEWYETLPARRGLDSTSKLKNVDLMMANRKRTNDKDDDSEEEERKRRKKRKKEKKRIKEEEGEEDGERRRKKHKKHKKKSSRHRDSSEERKIEEEYEKEKKKKLQMLRDERLKRERNESARSYAILHPQEAKKEKEEEIRRKPKYNSQFNPEFSRR